MPAEAMSLAEAQTASDRRDRVGEPRELGRRIDVLSGSRPAPTHSRGIATGGGGGGIGLRFPDRITIELDAEPRVEQTAEVPVPPSALERQYRGDLPRRPDRDLKQFGYDQIQRLGGPTTTAAGLAALDHVLVPGDEIIVDLTTDRVERLRAVVSRDGTVAFEGLVSLRAAGQTFEAFEASLRDEVARIRQNFDMSVGLGRLASVGVRVVGEAESPGLVDAGPRPTVLDALGSAGVRKSGSLRRITVRRASGDSVTIDLYAYLLGSGDAPDLRLSAGDTVSIPPIGPTIAVAGSVQRPGIYEIERDASSPTEAIELAGGLTGFALEGQIQIERTVGSSRILVDADPEAEAVVLQDGDTLLVGAVDGRLHPIVEIAGEVSRPGRFQHREGMTVGDLVRLAGGLTVDAADDQAIVSRVAGAPMGLNGAWDADSAPVTRRIMVVDLVKAARGDPAHDIVLEPLDLIRVRAIGEAREIPTVEIIGAARSAGVYELTAGMDVGDLIAIAGNLRPDAFREEAELVRRRRTLDATMLDVDRFRIPLSEILGAGGGGPTLRNGDRLIIRKLSRAEVRVRADGLVRFPGEYVLPAGSRITDLIAAAGGVLEGGDLRAARFTRASVRAMQADRWSELAERTRQTFERNLETRVNSARSKEAFSARIQLEQVQATLDRMQRTQATGRIVIPFTADDFPDSEANLALESGDALLVPRATSTITVQGHVFNPLTVVADASLSAQALIDQAGGFTEIADEKRIYVVRADGYVSSVAQKGGRFALRDPLLPGDIVLVPPRPLSRDAGSVALDLLLLARTAGEAVALWNLATSELDEGSISIIDTPASPRSDSTPPAEILREFQR
ncbi:MAG: SLBB domain-containing protein [Planctomycetota bacterium]